MTTNAFIGWKTKPSETELAGELGASKAAWDELVAALADDAQVDGQEWKSYSPKAGWSLRLLHGKRVIVYLIPCHGLFQVAFVLGDKAVKAARASKLPQRILAVLDKSPRYAEGTGVRLDVKVGQDLPAIRKLARIKLDN